MKIIYYMVLKSMIKHKEDLNLTNKQKSQIESLLFKVITCDNFGWRK